MADAEKKPTGECLRARPGGIREVPPIGAPDADDQDCEGHGRRNGHDPHACQDDDRGHWAYSLSLPDGMATARYSTGPKARTAT